MRSQKITFPNDGGQELSARLELPVNQHPHSYAIFAHCFTCTKNLTATRNISRELNQQGIAVLRFDFTGLGESEGDFADTNFSSNVTDLIAAARYLADHHAPPEILVGHSLGGAAVVCAAQEIESVSAVVTIGAPYQAAHVRHLLAEGLEKIKKEGAATVNLGGRPFQIKSQFLDDLERQITDDHIRQLGRALLILHSPQDRTVEIENAAKIYHAARHPKSFVTLDGADHMLSQKEDSQYAGQLIATWAMRYIKRPKKETLKADKQVAVRLGAEGYTTEIMVRQHALTADEPESVGGNDFGPSPYELVGAGLGACTAMTLQMYARRKKWDLREVTVQLHHYKDYFEDLKKAMDEKIKVDHFERAIKMEGNLDATQKTRLLEIADRCPVHRTLHNEVKIITNLVD